MSFSLLGMRLSVMFTFLISLLGLSHGVLQPTLGPCQLYLNPTYTTSMKEALPLSFTLVECSIVELARPLTIVTVIVDTGAGNSIPGDSLLFRHILNSQSITHTLHYTPLYTQINHLINFIHTILNYTPSHHEIAATS